MAVLSIGGTIGDLHLKTPRRARGADRSNSQAR